MSTLHSRGVASVEAVVVMPLFVIVFVSLSYLGKLVIARQNAEAKARTCTWLYSNDNCGKIPQRCEQAVLQLRDAAEQVDSRTESALAGADIWPVSIIVANVLKPVLQEAFGRAVTTNTSLPYERPPLYGGSSGTADGSYHLACNIARRTEMDVVTEAWDAILDALFPG